jgi:P-type Cu2+ transporter
MAGDGLNDAPALAAAFVSASTAMAADVSQTVADFAFQGEGLASLLDALVVTKKLRR